MLKVQKAIARLKSATEFRNEAAHDDIEPADAKQVYIEAKSFLDILVKEDPRTAIRS
jgi:hypothetical protein